MVRRLEYDFRKLALSKRFLGVYALQLLGLSCLLGLPQQHHLRLLLVVG